MPNGRRAPVFRGEDRLYEVIGQFVDRDGILVDDTPVAISLPVAVKKGDREIALRPPVALVSSKSGKGGASISTEPAAEGHSLAEHFEERSFPAAHAKTAEKMVCPPTHSPSGILHSIRSNRSRNRFRRKMCRLFGRLSSFLVPARLSFPKVLPHDDICTGRAIKSTCISRNRLKKPAISAKFPCWLEFYESVTLWRNAFWKTKGLEENDGAGVGGL